MNLVGQLRQLTTHVRGSGAPRISIDDEPPLRSELFSVEQMAQHGKALAGSHKLAPGRAPDQLLARLAENEITLVSVCNLLTAEISAKRRITPAGEWLLDNFYLIEEQIRTAKRHLPKGYSRELPRLENGRSGSSAGRPRVYDIALETIAHGDGRVDTESLSRFVAAYQTVTALKLGELWAIPIMLRLAVIENLRRVAVLIAAGWVEGNLGDSWADQITEAAEKDPKGLILVIADMARSNPPMVGAFVAELARRLQGRGPSLALPLTWIEQRLSESGLTIEQLVQSENQRLAADQVSISNSIGSLRVLGAIDWRAFVETMSVVEQTLLEDPGGVYGRMDFATRDRYRHATEAIAKKGPLTEGEVARKALELARARTTIDTGGGAADRSAHVGYYLVGEGLPELERGANVRLSGAEALRRTAGRFPLPLYLGGIALITMIISASLLAQALATGMAAGVFEFARVAIGILLLLATSQLAVSLVNWLATLLVTPHSLPRMDFSEGIPPTSRTLVVIPTMLTSASSVEHLVEALEVRFLANRDRCLHFGLLTDFLDAHQETLPEDVPLLQLARTRIDALNQKYVDEGGETGGGTFFLFHRPRRWNPTERIWMGFERKRGKLADLNALLRAGERGVAAEGFSLVVGNTAALSGVKYVITLDTDTQLPRDAARQFVAAMAHPLNRPRYDEARQRVCAGYGILQPRVAVSLPGTNRSLYARLYGGEPGIDPYTRAVSDVYQDLFGEGSFIGKGIYDVDAFEQALGGRFPENRILSHDLLEGCYARSGLLSDVHLYEDYPARYSADVSRRYRWIRGDWQLAGWLLSRVPGEGARRRKNPLSVLSQWKLIDNLRRSLVPAALTLLLVLGWSVLAPAWLWTLTVIGILLIPSLCAWMVDVLRKREEATLRQHFAAVARSASRQLKQLAFELACLPYEAFFSLQAIVQTAWRLLVTRRRLLEWNPSSEAARVSTQRGGSDLAVSFRSMWIAPAIAASLAIYLALSDPAVLAVAGPILLLWFASPAIAWWISRPLAPRKTTLTVEQTHFLRALARRTWAFFDTFVGPQDHWLPPDNFQEYRLAAVAHRTSPTNMGLALLANLSAYDFGYLPAGQLVERTANTLRTMETLERHRGHFFNWYDSQSLQPLSPLYISSVDSGNLEGHLMTLRAGLLALVDDRILAVRLFEGLSDTLRVFEDEDATDARDRGAAGPLAAFRNTLDAACTAPPSTLAAARLCLERLATVAAELVTQVSGNRDVGDGSVIASEANEWAQALARQCREALDDLSFLADSAAVDTIPTLRELAKAGSSHARDRVAATERLALQCGDLARMDFDFLFDKSRHLLSIGYNVSEHRADASYYDLLASEARLCSFVAIAQGQLPQESWFALGRLLTGTGGDPVLLSWSGSMFEYLMPLLVMPTYDNTLLDQTCKAAVARQIQYGTERGVPWGISECGYNIVDVHLNYQYRAFGVPGLGLKRGLAEDLVIAPYASALALMVAPEEACLNLQRLAAEGFVGRFGFFEAIDYTPARQRRGQSRTVVRSFMAHHQGMSLLALAYLLLDRPMQRRFASDRLFQAVLLLLQERIPKDTALFSHTAQLSEGRSASGTEESPIRVFSSPDTPTPEVKLLSNGRYHVMVTNAGGGYSRWKDLAVTRWREDATCDNWGTFCYIREVTNGANGAFWSTGYQPALARAQNYEAIFSEGRAEFRRRDSVGIGGNDYFETHTEIVVSPEDDIELRRVRITNRSRQRRQIDVTSYAEVVIAPPAADALHPAFSNLFVQTEILRERHAILCTRRSRSRGEQAPWMFHLMTAHGADVGVVSYETDRLRFIGRARSTAAPLAMSDPAALSGTEGSVLDPIVAIRCLLGLDPEQSATIDIVSGIGETREIAVSLIDKYQDRHLADRVFDLAWTHVEIVLRQLNVGEADAQLYARLASSVIYANASLRADPAMLIKNRGGQSGLWGYAISGDLPIVLLQISDAANIDLVRQLVQAHAYWRLKGLAADLVIWNEDHAGYRQQLQDQIMGLITSGIEASVIDRPGGIFVRSAEQISGEDRILFQSVARVVIMDGRGTLAEQLDHRGLVEPRMPQLAPTQSRRPEATPASALSRDLILFNGLGGFTPDGREYVIALAPGEVTPAPWVNVLANPYFGTLVSENGVAYTWSENAHEFRLTPWHNDPVTDAGGESHYLRDEETCHVWSPSPLPAGASIPFVVRHGFGYSVFETSAEGIRSELWVYVAMDAAVKFSVLKMRNESGRARRLSATGYVEWVLGDLRAKSAMHVTTEIAPRSGALYARNPYSMEFADRVAFFDVDDPKRTLSGDRAEFLGRNGTLRNPAALNRSRLSGKVGAGLDPCGAIQVNFDLADGQEREIVFRLGVGRNVDEAGQLVQRFRGALAARGALEAVWQYWNHTLGAVQVETPDQSVNVLANGWLVYQTLACRIWARSGYYQSGGAFGCRDQLQDAMALIHTEPALVRNHLLLCASRQFPEGDVQHWWHPPSGRGVRTRCSDDYLWLPLAVCRYVMSTGDIGVLDEPVHFLEGRLVNPEDDSYYDLPGRSADVASVYQHCVRAIRHGLQFGQHGLPLIGSGDWNDGMNLVGIRGKGESVWLGFFLCEVLRKFAEVASVHRDPSFAELCLGEGARLRESIEEHGWDGKWYRRAYFDDGTPLGSAGNAECQIDSISQSWSVLSAVGTPVGQERIGKLARSRMAMKAVDERLVRREHALIQLLDPPFDKANLDPGYIRGYVPGVRENGGQYTHGAIWAAMAFAALGERERAWELLTMINPVNHTLSAEGIASYKVEPYVVAADVYALTPHIGRGGWSWYSGSAGWMYRLIVESLLGLRLEAETLRFAPCLPAHWHGLKIHYRYRETVYHIVISQISGSDEATIGTMTVMVDGVERLDRAIALVDDHRDHTVEVRVNGK
ncbi:MAG: cyclic beta 1-2 glucan synthetase [Sterolibacteriaceae bacterium]|uniref:Cyclic beta 1-2 glucan synthetase n=1 Tax=Candidatus Methylophosphatis roskildensis TaxID=2899263 RepID=A0A9D7E3Y1_9PROT|nr:cyclic beta 1-2 glucan synthetase [Candidatus Methylophosphatis roskildensis]